MNPHKRLMRPRKGRVIAGVASGLAQYFNINVTIMRIIWIILLLPGGIPGAFPYIILWVAMPSEGE